MPSSSEPQTNEQGIPGNPGPLELSGVYNAAIATLRLGFTTAAVFFTIGVIWSAVAREEISDHVTPIEDIPRQLAGGTPMAAIVLAFLVLMFTPVITVLRVGVAFLRLGPQSTTYLTETWCSVYQWQLLL